jgi:hypothetical protein
VVASRTGFASHRVACVGNPPGSLLVLLRASHSRGTPRSCRLPGTARHTNGSCRTIAPTSRRCLELSAVDPEATLQIVSRSASTTETPLLYVSDLDLPWHPPTRQLSKQLVFFYGGFFFFSSTLTAVLLCALYEMKGSNSLMMSSPGRQIELYTGVLVSNNRYKYAHQSKGPALSTYPPGRQIRWAQLTAELAPLGSLHNAQLHGTGQRHGLNMTTAAHIARCMNHVPPEHWPEWCAPRVSCIVICTPTSTLPPRWRVSFQPHKQPNSLFQIVQRGI